jgi:AI-2 transport protein TqsA
LADVPPISQEGWSIARKLFIGGMVVLIIAGFMAASSIITTLFFAFVIAVSVTPLMNWLRRRGLPLWLSFSMVALAVAVFVITVFALLIVSIHQFVGVLPTYQDRIGDIEDTLSNFLNSHGVDIQRIRDLNTFQPSSMINFMVSLLKQVAASLSNWGFILFLAAFMLIESAVEPAKLQKALHSDSPVPSRILNFTENIRSYIVINAWIGLLCAIINTVVLVLLGVDFAVLWGVFSFLMSFVPMVGFVISVIPPMLLALFEFGLLRALIVLAAYIIINTITDNIVYPRIVGRGLNLSALVVILSVFFWTWVLGPLGAILAVPLTMMVKELFLDASDETRWLGMLMEPLSDEDEVKESITG